MFACRLACASLNSSRKPFSLMFSRFQFSVSHVFRLRLPVYRRSTAMFLPIDRPRPTDHDCVYGIRMFGSNTFMSLPAVIDAVIGNDGVWLYAGGQRRDGSRSSTGQ